MGAVLFRKGCHDGGALSSTEGTIETDGQGSVELRGLPSAAGR